MRVGKKWIGVGIALAVILFALAWSSLKEQFWAYSLGKAEAAKLPDIVPRGFKSYYAIGLVEVAGTRSTRRLPAANRVEIYFLGDEVDEKATNCFPSHAYGKSFYSVLRTKTLEGRSAVDFADAWRDLECHWALSGICHEPAYGLRFYHGAKLLFETDLCWVCSNFGVKTTWGYALCGVQTTNASGCAFPRKTPACFADSANWRHRIVPHQPGLATADEPARC